jgi:flagellar hook-length control protein FliK
MDTSLLAVADIVVETEGFGAAATRSSERRGSSFAALLEADMAADQPQPLPNNPDRHTSPHAPPAPKTDNMRADAASEPATKPANNSRRLANRPGDKPRTRPKAGHSEKAGKRGPTSDPPNPAEIVKLWLSEHSPNLEPGKEGLAAKMQPKAGHQLAQLIADSQGRQIGPPTEKATGPAGLNHLPVSRGKTDSQTVLPDPLPKLDETVGKSTQSTNGQHLSASAKSIVAAAVPANQQAGPKGISEEAVQGQPSKTLSGGPIAVENGAASKPGPQIPMTGKSQVPLDSNQMPPSHQQLAASDTSQTQSQAGNVSPNQPSPSQLQSQAVLTGPNNSTTPADEPKETNIPGGRSRARSNGANPKESAEHALEGISPKKLNQDGLQVQVRAGQTKSRNSSASKDSSHAGLERMLLQNNTQPQAAKPASGLSAGAAKPTGAPAPSADSPAQQVLEYIRSSLRPGDQQITIRLNPPELGKVLINLQERQEQITGLLEVSKLQTRYEIEQALPQIIRALHDAGVQVKRLEVVLDDQAQQQNLRDQSQSLHDGLLQEQKFAQGGRNYDEPADEWLTDDAARPDVYQSQSYVTDDSIDMLL